MADSTPTPQSPAATGFPDSQGRTLPANAWCTRPPTPEEQAAAAARAAAAIAAEPTLVERQLDAYASHIVGTKHYANRPTYPEYGSVPADMPDLSPEALELAHGCRIGKVRIWKYFSRKAYACLDCHWVGEHVPCNPGSEPDAAAAAAHARQCPGRPE